MKWHLILATFNSLAFLYYGLTCVFSKKMVDEFKRFGLTSRQRMMTGVLQVMGAVGVLFGIIIPFFGMMATAGLTILMLLGFVVRIKVRDGIKSSAPSFFFMLLNAYLFYHFWQAL
jgi:hypothetical protein